MARRVAEPSPCARMRRATAFMTAATAALLNGIAAADVPVFRDEAVKRGLGYIVTDGEFGGLGQYGCGVALCDLDGDGDDDIVAMGAASNQIAIFANDGNGAGAGRFIDRTAGSGLPILSKASGIVAADYDGDGDLDLFVTRWLASAVLLRNDGALRFTNVTAQAQLSGISGPGSGCAFGDFDGDGDLDLAVGMRTSSAGNLARNRFYRNNGDGTFTDIAASLGVNDGFATFQCILQDLDRDGDCDLYVSNDKGVAGISWNRLFRNQGGAFAEDIASGACISIDSMGVCAGDLDMNGFVDVYCTNLPATGHALLASNDGMRYERRDLEAGVGGDAVGFAPLIFDADNDGDQDLFACSMSGAPDYLWLNETGFPLVERSAACGIGDADDSYCLASGDIDGDGDVDLLMQSRGVNLRLYVNNAPAQNHSVELRIVGSGMNTHAVGALADITVHGRTALREVAAGSLYKSQSSYVLHAGLGDALVADQVVVRWPRVGKVREERVLRNVPSGFVVPVYPSSRLGDAAGDGRVDPADVAACDACVASGVFTAACAVFDIDGDCRVDAADRAAVYLRMVDLDHDGVIGPRDLVLLLDGWGRPQRDLTGDGVVGPADVAVMLAAW